MPIHYNDIDVIPEVAGLSSALIVPCQMCPAVTVAVREKEPFIQFFKNFFKSGPFERYMKDLQSRLQKKGVDTKVFWSYLPHHWFLCMWTSRKCRKLKAYAQAYEAVIVIGCESATETVRNLVDLNKCKVIEGMAVEGIMNAKLKFQLPCDISFYDCKVIPISQKSKAENGSTKQPGINISKDR
jgi:hypothetical protein